MLIKLLYLCHNRETAPEDSVIKSREKQREYPHFHCAPLSEVEANYPSGLLSYIPGWDQKDNGPEGSRFKKVRIVTVVSR